MPDDNSPEIAFHELGEAVAVAAASVHDELSRHPNALGAYVLDDLELTIPVHMRIDDMGQVLVSLDGAATPGGASLRFRVRPALGERQPSRLAPMQPIALLRLPPKAIATLEAHRIFSVNDLLRVFDAAPGRAALVDMGLGADLDAAIGRAALLTLATLPPALGEALVGADVKDPDAFLAADPKRLARDLSRILAQPIPPDVVHSWQESTREAFRIQASHALPTHKSTPPRAVTQE